MEFHVNLLGRDLICPLSARRTGALNLDAVVCAITVCSLAVNESAYSRHTPALNFSPYFHSLKPLSALKMKTMLTNVYQCLYSFLSIAFGLNQKSIFTIDSQHPDLIQINAQIVRLFFFRKVSFLYLEF